MKRLAVLAAAAVALTVGMWLLPLSWTFRP
jgi:hypothetical protein